jgi:copper chaperone CopZ
MCQGGKKEVVLAVPTLKCESCGEKLKAALEQVKGVDGVQVQVQEQRIVVNIKPCAVSEQQLLNAAELAGFPAGAA